MKENVGGEIDIKAKSESMKSKRFLTIQIRLNATSLRYNGDYRLRSIHTKSDRKYPELYVLACALYKRSLMCFKKSTGWIRSPSTLHTIAVAKCKAVWS